VEDPAECGRVLDEALGTPGPALVEAVVDPYQRPYPAKITLEQASRFALSLVRGEPNREKIALTVLSDTVRERV
jgi:pyruvate dehydrogenase (quinone)